MSARHSARSLAYLARRLEVGERVCVVLDAGEDAEALRRRLRGAGFGSIRRSGRSLQARREFTLPDYVRRRMRLLVCGLNPSPYSARSGVPFGRPGNRFWPAARLAGLIEAERDPFAALARGIGFTDLAKRTTAAASDLEPAEYRRGFARVEALVRSLRPRSVCFVGLDGWRQAVDTAATPGWIAGGFAGRAAYLMPSTSGRNAHASLRQLGRHLREAASR